MSEKKLQMDQRIDVEEILQDLDQYRPRRRNWVWRTPAKDQHAGPFTYREISEPMGGESPAPALHHHGDRLRPV